MARITVEDCLEKVNSQYDLVMLAKERTSQLNAGDKSLVPEDGDIGAFLINNTEATVKYVDTIANKRYLIPANKNYSNIEIDENISHIGKVVSLFRDM